MNVTIQIKYLSNAGRVMQRGSFPLRGRKPEKIAYDWLQQIKRQVTYQELISVVADGDQDITEKVRELEKAPLE